MFRAAWLVSLPALLVPPAAASEPLVVQPSSSWNLHYAENSCQLKRQFGGKDKGLLLMLERVSPESPLSLLLVGGPLRARAREGEAAAAFLPFGDNPFPHGAVAETIDDKRTAILWTSVELVPGSVEAAKRRTEEGAPRDLARRAAEQALELANAAKVTGIEVRERGRRKIVLATGPLSKALALMRQCAREQLSDYGVDPDVEDRIVVSARRLTPWSKVLRSDDYPMAALVHDQQSILNARVNIGADGKVTRCTTLSVFTSPHFADVVCRRLSLAQFAPAELADGTKVPSYSTITINFRLPD